MYAPPLPTITKIKVRVEGMPASHVKLKNGSEIEKLRVFFSVRILCPLLSRDIDGKNFSVNPYKWKLK